MFRWVRYKNQYLLIELGRFWEIRFTGELVESVLKTEYPKITNDGLLTANKRILFTKFIKEGEVIPFWYGYAYRDFDTDTIAYMPVPLNLIRAAFERFKYHVWWYLRSIWPRKLDMKHIEVRDAKIIVDKWIDDFPTNPELKKVSKILNKIRGYI